jgi:predicted transcriptional regulator
LGKSQFTIYNFITNSFAFSPSRKGLMLKLLEALKQEPKSFAALVGELSAPKGTLYLLCLSLERSGLVKKGADGRYSLDGAFSQALREYANWWEGWVNAPTP